MANIILKFRENKKSSEKNSLPIAFYNKKVYFVAADSPKIPKPDETWECFLWVEKPKYTLVKPFRKVDESDIDSEIKRVANFNMELDRMQRYLKEKDFEKIVFDEKNKPYLKTTLPMPKVIEKYSDFIVIKKDNGEKWLRPIMTAEDRKAYQMQAL